MQAAPFLAGLLNQRRYPTVPVEAGLQQGLNVSLVRVEASMLGRISETMNLGTKLHKLLKLFEKGGFLLTTAIKIGDKS